MVAIHDYETAILDLARLTRELQTEIHQRVTQDQIGEAFIGLETLNHEHRDSHDHDHATARRAA